MSDWVGQTLSNVEIQNLYRRGGMAEIYLGHHITLNRPVAVKILHPHLFEDSRRFRRFRTEAQIVAAMRHPNIVQVFDFDVAEGCPYIVMELLEGLPLDEYLQILHGQGRKLPPEIVTRLILALAAALDYAHAQGIIHRDIKPANVILRRESGPIEPDVTLPLDVEPVLTDFGVARLLNNTIRTDTGDITGTPAYINPEQARGEAVDGRSDVYSLGVMLYEMLAGKLPFNAPNETPFSLIFKHITEMPPPIPDISPAVQAILDRMLAKDREARYQQAGDAAADLLLIIFGQEPNRQSQADSREPSPFMDELLSTLDLLLDQSRTYERALPPNNYPARMAVASLSELARRALNEAHDLADSLKPDPPGPHPFSPREHQVLGLVAEGLTNKEIAYRLGISDRTIQYHLNSIFNKSATESRTEAVALAMSKGWIGPPHR